MSARVTIADCESLSLRGFEFLFRDVLHRTGGDLSDVRIRCVRGVWFVRAGDKEVVGETLGNAVARLRAWFVTQAEQANRENEELDREFEGGQTE